MTLALGAASLNSTGVHASVPSSCSLACSSLPSVTSARPTSDSSSPSESCGFAWSGAT